MGGKHAGLALPHRNPHDTAMTSKIPRSAAGKAAVAAGAIGSAAIAAAYLYSSRRKERRDKAKANQPVTPSGEPPQTD